MTAVFCGLTFAFAQPLLSLLSIAAADAEGAALGYAYTYMLWTVVIGGLPTALAMTLAHFLRGEGQAKKASAGMMLGGILNIGLDPLFMFAFGMGFAGAGIATALSNFISFLFLLGCSCTEERLLSCRRGSFPSAIRERCFRLGFRRRLRRCLPTSYS